MLSACAAVGVHASLSPSSWVVVANCSLIIRQAMGIRRERCRSVLSRADHPDLTGDSASDLLRAERRGMRAFSGTVPITRRHTAETDHPGPAVEPALARPAAGGPRTQAGH
jgi:hypothetical protein